jgi:hypothetical protein
LLDAGGFVGIVLVSPAIGGTSPRIPAGAPVTTKVERDVSIDTLQLPR